MQVVTYKNRACTRKAATAVKVSALNERMAVHCDKVLAKERDQEERKSRREGFKSQRLAKKAQES
jgi:hypothetical protein